MNTLKKYSLEVLALILGVIMVSAFVILGENNKPAGGEANILEATEALSEDVLLTLEERVMPSDGVLLPVRWGDLGRQMVDAGVIDIEKFEGLYARRGGIDEEMQNLIYGNNNGNLYITSDNAGILLNLLWAFGLGNKNPILEEGPMTKYGNAGLSAEALAKAGRFASTGGWSLASGDVMDHYSKHPFIVLTAGEQALVERVSRGIFRPCCGNSTYFPDCNHGMAMLGLLELLASQGVDEKTMYKVALQVNSYWFSDTYLNIARYFENRGVAWSDVDPKEVLGDAFSSGSGYQRVLQEIEPLKFQGNGGGCGV